MFKLTAKMVPALVHCDQSVSIDMMRKRFAMGVPGWQSPYIRVSCSGVGRDIVCYEFTRCSDQFRFLWIAAGIHGCLCSTSCIPGTFFEQQRCSVGVKRLDSGATGRFRVIILACRRADHQTFALALAAVTSQYARLFILTLCYSNSATRSAAGKSILNAIS